MDTSDKTLTLDTFLTWKTETLREYLGKRGLAKDKAKQELAALCYSAHIMKIPEIPSAAENLKVRQSDYTSLLNFYGTTIPDPFTLHKNWTDERYRMKSWPPVYLSDIVEKETGAIKSSYCTCTAGLGSPCVNVVSVLFRIESAHRLGVSACTSLPCSWTVPASKSTKTSTAPPLKLKELQVSKPVHSLTCGKKRPLVSTIKKEYNPIHTNDSNTTKGCLKDITDAIRNSIPNACVLKGIDIPKEEVKLRTDQPVNIQKYMIDRMVMDGLIGPSSVHDLNQETVEALNKATVGQHANSTWHDLRKGRITSSNFHSVQCKIKYNRNETVVNPLLCNIMGYTFVNPNIKPLKHGREMEPIARSEYVSFIKKKITEMLLCQNVVFLLTQYGPI